MKPWVQESVATAASFGLGTIVGGACYSAIEVFYLGTSDPKFTEVPHLAFQLEFVGVLLLAVVGTVAFALAMLARRRASHLAGGTVRRRILLAALLGGLYLPGVSLIVKPIRTVLPPEAWVTTICAGFLFVVYPLMVGFLLTHE